MAACWPIIPSTCLTSRATCPPPARPLPPPTRAATSSTPKRWACASTAPSRLPTTPRPPAASSWPPYVITDFKTYAGALYTVALENLNPVQPADWQRTISINFLGFSPRIKRISAAQKAQLMASGRAGVQAFFARPPN